MGMKTYFTQFTSPLGPLQLRGTDTALQALYIAENRHRPPLPHNALRDKSPLRRAQEQVEEFLAGQRRCFSLPLEMQGTPFQVCVWQELLTIPYGKTASYGEIAQKIGAPGAGRAVGSANGRNPLSLIVPCHRVIGAGGALGGYSGGLAQKRFLLSLEQEHAAPRRPLDGFLVEPQAAGQPDSGFPDRTLPRSVRR
jgi:methylated-DNA-[protein]-cysteine S-methyltransferase